MQTKLRIIIADDHLVVIEGLKALLKEFDFIEVIGYAENGEELIEQATIHNPDIILTDIHMPVKDGVEATKELHKKFPKIKIIALTMQNESVFIKKMLTAGVSAYVLKTVAKEELIRIIKKVASGEKHFSAEITNQLINNFQNNSSTSSPFDLLTKREKEIVQMITKGLTDKEIADKIHLSPLTIITHRKNILHKLGLKNKVELTRLAFSHNLLS